MENNLPPEIILEEQNQPWLTRHHYFVVGTVVALTILALGVWFYMWLLSPKITGPIEEYDNMEQSLIVNSSVSAEPKIDLQNLEWKTYRNEEYGFEVSVPKQTKEEPGEGIIKYKTEFDVPGTIEISFKNEMLGCDVDQEQLTTDIYGWSIQKIPTSFCAVNGTHGISVYADTHHKELNKRIIDSVKLSANKLVTQKYSLLCEDSERYNCSLKQDNKILIKNFTGGDNSILAFGLYVSYSIMGWDDQYVYLEGGGGDACGGRWYLYSFSVQTLKAKQLSMAEANCAQTDSGLAAELADYEAHQRAKAYLFNLLPNKYPGYKLE